MEINTFEEQQILNEFRKIVEDLGQNDDTLLRFLRARNHNLPLAEEMLRNSVKWRKDNDIDNALEWEISESVRQAFPYEFTGLDSDNRSVLYIPLGQWPVREFIEKGEIKEVERHVYQMLERFQQEAKRTGGKATFLADEAEVTYWKLCHYPTIQACMQILVSMEAHYPEQISRIFIINAPAIFNWGWRFFKRAFSGRTLQYTELYGCNKKEYVPEILKRIPKSSLPQNLQEQFENCH